MIELERSQTQFFKMSEKEKSGIKSNDLFSAFMKKQIDEKSKKKGSEIKASTKKKSEKSKSDSSDQENKDETLEEEMTEEEELEDAKKASRNKAAQTDQTEMIKKMILENIVKYTALIAVITIFAFAVIKFGAAFLAAINGIVFKALMSSIGK